METHPLIRYTAQFVETHGVPYVLDVEHSIQVYRPTLTGAGSPASYYIRPPEGTSAEAFIEWFESAPNYADYRLTLISILGLDTYHQPIVSANDFAKKHFSNNQLRIVRVVGKSDQAIEAIAAFIEALRVPFDAKLFPEHSDFAVSAYEAKSESYGQELKLLFKPADPTKLMKVARLVVVYLDENNIGRDIRVSRHSTRNQPPELILAATGHSSAGLAFLESLASSLPRATEEEVTRALDLSLRGNPSAGPDPQKVQAAFSQPKPAAVTLSSVELRRKVIGSMFEVMKYNFFEKGVEIKVVQGGLALEVTFPRTISSLFLATSFNEVKHIKKVAGACVGVRSDPQLREGWAAQYQYDSKSGSLQIRAVDMATAVPAGWKLVPVLD